MTRPWDTPLEFITPRDLKRSRTARSIKDLTNFLQALNGVKVRRILDVGCGYGGVTKVIGQLLGADELHGIEIDPSTEEEARSKGVIIHNLDAETERFPFSDGYFDLVTSFGVLDYLPSFDNVIYETNRVLCQEGLCLFSLPNLSSWVNRLLLLLGYQPIDVEVSRKILVGTHPTYGKVPSGHIHTVTTEGFKQLVEFYGFRTIRVAGLHTPPYPPLSLPLRVLFFPDSIMNRRASLSRRFLYLGIKRQSLDPGFIIPTKIYDSNLDFKTSHHQQRTSG